MKTKLFLFRCSLLLILMMSGIKSWAQVGGLTRTGDVTVCLNSTESYGVIVTPGSSYAWSILPGSGGAGSIIDGVAPNNLISVTWTGIGTCMLQVVETAAGCTGIPVTIQVNVLPALLPGTASADQTINANVAPAPISSTPPTGGDGTYTYQWEFSIDGGTTWAIIAGATTLSYTPGALTQTTKYHLIQASATGCSSVTTNAVTINVLNPLVAGTATGDQSICYNGTPAPVTSTAPTGGNGIYTYQWESSIDGGSTWVTVPGATTLAYAPGALIQTTLYHLVQSPEGGSGSVITNNVTLTVQSQVITSPIYHN